MKNLILLLCTFVVSNGFALVHSNVNFMTHDQLNIEGEITLPENTDEKLPGVIMIHGTGALDMDLTIPGDSTADGKEHKMFKLIAEHLGESGVISLRYNKRGVTLNSDGSKAVDRDVYYSGDIENLKKDVHSAIAKLREHPSIDPSRIILLGISEGTVLAPLVAVEDGNIAGLILLSSMGQNLRDVLYFQIVERSLDLVNRFVDQNHDGYIERFEANLFPELSLPFEAIDRDSDDRISLAELKSILLRQHYSGLDRLLTGPLKSWISQHFSLPPNYLNIAEYEGPMLLLHGEIDAQTPLSDALLIKDELTGLKRTNFKMRVIEGVGHGFSPNIGTQQIIPTLGPTHPDVFTEIQDWVEAGF